MAVKSLLPHPLTFIYYQYYITIGDIMEKVEPILKQCKQCKREFETSLSKMYGGRGKFCSRECYFAWKKDNNAQVRQICKQCKQEFGTIQSEIKRGGGRFCSRECYHAWKVGENNPNWRGGGVRFTCQNCGRVFQLAKSKLRRQTGRFCSRKCSAEWVGKVYRGEKRWNWKGGKKERICKECGTTFLVKACDVKRGRGIFCSKGCYGKYLAKSEEACKRIMGLRGIYCRPTKPERKFQEICEKHNLEFRYTGDGKMWIGKERKLNPDFVDANGRKVCVEIMGVYWHSPLLNRSVPERASFEYRNEHYKRYGWHPIFIWDTDLTRKDAEQFLLITLARELK